MLNIYNLITVIVILIAIKELINDDKLKKKYKRVSLSFEHKNSIILINKKITNYSIVKIINQINSYSNFKLNPANSLHSNYMSILINSNGGDLMKSYELVMHMNIVPNLKFKCYALNAYSSAFVIFQYCNERYVLSKSQLIHHNGSITIKGSFEIVKDFLENDFKVMQLIHDKINKNIAERINMSYSNFMNKIHNNWVISGGENIIKNNLADEIVNMNGFDFFV